MPKVRRSRPRLSERRALSGDSAQGATLVMIASRTRPKVNDRELAKGMYRSGEEENLNLACSPRSAAALEWAGAGDRPKIVEPFSPERGIDWGVDQLGVDPHQVVVW